MAERVVSIAQPSLQYVILVSMMLALLALVIRWRNKHTQQPRLAISAANVDAQPQQVVQQVHHRTIQILGPQNGQVDDNEPFLPMTYRP